MQSKSTPDTEEKESRGTYMQICHPRYKPATALKLYWAKKINLYLKTINVQLNIERNHRNPEICMYQNCQLLNF